MKRKKHYTFIIAKNSSTRLKKITVGQKYVHIFLSGLLGLALLLTAFLTDYFGRHVDQWKLSHLKKENRQLEEQLARVDSQLKDLEQKIYQISDFSKKLQLITNASPEQINKTMGFGKIHSSSAIVALSSSRPSQRSISSLSSQKEKIPDSFNSRDWRDIDELEIRIEKLKGQSELVKQDAWTLYTDLLEKQEILNNTPSIQPVRGWLSSNFGYRNETIYSDHEPHFHRGVDIASTEGNPVIASADGKVIYTGYDEYGYGNLIVVDHGYGLKTYYAHLAEIKTKIGKTVKKGEPIASVGSTGRSTGPHLHYEVRIFSVPVNPENYILDQSDFFML